MTSEIFVTLKTEDRPLLEMQKRIEKLMLMQIWVRKAASLLSRYHRILDENNEEIDTVKRGINLEELEICFMSSVSYFLRCFLNQKGSLNIELNNITKDEKLIQTYKMLMALRNDEYVHWKGARSKLSARYSFSYQNPNVCEFARTVQTDYSETVGPDQNSEQMKLLFQVTDAYLEQRWVQELNSMRLRLAKAEAWTTTNLYNERDEPIMIKS